MRVKVGRLVVSACGALLATVITAQSALAGSGTGVIHVPNPASILIPGVTEISFRDLDCTKVPANQGLDAWIVPLEDNDAKLVIKAESLPTKQYGYTFYVAFYSAPNGKWCDRQHGVTPVGNPTRPLSTDGAKWAVISIVTAGVDVQISWRACPNSECST